MKKRTLLATVPFVFVRVFLLLALIGVISRPVSARSNLPAPANLRVDISDGTTGQLFVSWDPVSGASYYNVQRSTFPTGPWLTVADCSGTNPHQDLDVEGSEVCRDNMGVSAVTAPPTYYFYQVQACNSVPCSGSYTQQTPVTRNTPVFCDCGSSQIPSTQNLTPPARIPGLATSKVTPGALFDVMKANGQAIDEVAAYANYPNSLGIPYRGILVVQLPGSDETCDRGALLYTAQNLGFDVMCVNYDNRTGQETICQGHLLGTHAAPCFGNISQAKLDATGPCGRQQTATRDNCGEDPAKGGPYHLSNAADAVIPRITTMLQYLCNHNNSYYTNWGNYLSGINPCSSSSSDAAPNWSKIILGGHSQGGNMATFAAYKYPVYRVINLSAPAQATLVQNATTQDYAMTAASYLGPQAPDIRSFFGLVSVNDKAHYDPAGVTPPTASVFQAVWTAMGFTAANNDGELKLNTVENNHMTGLKCSETPSHNFSSSALVNDYPDGRGHDDPLFIWNEDIYKFMLLAE